MDGAVHIYTTGEQIRGHRRVCTWQHVHNKIEGGVFSAVCKSAGAQLSAGAVPVHQWK